MRDELFFLGGNKVLIYEVIAKITTRTFTTVSANMETHSDMKAMKQYRFSLIEMLIAVAILAILGSMLQPALRNIQTNAEDLLCKSNISKVGNGVLFHSIDHGGRIVPNVINPSNSFFWAPDSPYQKSWGASAWWHHLFYSKYVEAASFDCPTAVDTLAEGGLHYAKDENKFFNIDYGFNGWINWSNELHRHEPTTMAYIQYQDIPSPSMSIGIVDFERTSPLSMHWHYRGPYERIGLRSYYEGSGKTNHYFHNDRANMWFLDGHVEGLHGFEVDRDSSSMITEFIGYDKPDGHDDN
ncbi:MAG: prepilin-type N-terminal cleavage/methylation domain-containing protein [Planctomycetes bacterium]|nr:prepilin-type N-terminal cleavage/methylation domain-containing protein [Planctomycetota bacterium]